MLLKKKIIMLLLSPCKLSFSSQSLQCGCNLRSQCSWFEGWPSTHLSFAAEDSGEVGGTDALKQSLLPENGRLDSLTLGLSCAAFRVLVLAKVTRKWSGTVRNISKTAPCWTLSFPLLFMHFSWTSLPSAVLKCHPLHKFNGYTPELMMELSHNCYLKRFKSNRIYWLFLF